MNKAMRDGQAVDARKFLRRSKFHNVPTYVDNYLFDSKLEARRYGELKLLKLAGQIQDLEFHRRWPLHVNGQKIGEYESDFSYLENGTLVVEDVKGKATPLYLWKKKHLFAQYGISIVEIRA